MINKSIPLLTIVIPSFNQGQFLERTIVSVINQSSAISLELICMDGGSTDNTIEILKKYSRHFSFCVSEKDSGQSHAINKGFSIAKGQYVTWLNSDDLLLEGSLSSFKNAVSQNPEIKLFFGNTAWIDVDDKILRLRKGEQYNKFFSKNGLFFAYGPSAFIHKSLISEFGYLREDFHYMMDTELWHRYNNYNIKYYRINKYIWGLRLHENAKMSGHNFKNSVMANESHHSFLAKDIEKNSIKILYLGSKENIIIKKAYIISKLFSLRYLWSLFESFRFQKKEVFIIKNK